MNIISGIGESGFLANSAFSAGIATKDSNGNDITATYLTGVDLTPYQTTAGMTAYMSTADSANFYTTANESGFVTSGELPDPITIGVQEGDTLDTDYDGLKIVKATANGNEHINLHKKSTDQWLIHGGLVPTSPGSNKYLITDDSGAMHWDNKSALAYDSAFEQSGGYITAYNGSAFKAGTVATSAGIVGDGSTQNPLRADETVLFSGTQTYSATLSESVKNFDKILIEYGPNNYFNAPIATFFTDNFADNNAVSGVHLEFVEHNGTAAYCFPKVTTFVWHNNFTHLDAIGGIQYRVSGNAIQNESTGNQLYIRKIIGINRKAQ